MFEWWTVLPESERQQWTLEPFVSVGPLHFGMSPSEVTAALGGTTTRPQYRDGLVEMAKYREAGLTLYYSSDEKLKAVSIDALRGPQVFADGTALVGRVPSEIEQWMEDRAASREPYEELGYMNAGEPGSISLGVVVGVQRAGDHLLTRPVFLPAEAMDDPSHWLPREAWAIQD
ncbi:hypothetical protein AB0J35_28205 [Nonomuraea angiospora]|uniref:hypothetical protein n=1 Tax=Nonomuraea angiospora TaxID=46172 RepID=UPI00342BE09E